MTIPSVPMMRAFAAAGRTLSFTRAAAELGVSQAAVSQQIKALEAELGVALFRRTTRKIELTRAGLLLLPAVSTAFSGIERALDAIRRDKTVLTLTTTAAFGAKWLAPRLRRFAERHPEIELTVRHTEVPLDLATEEVDLAIRGGQGRWPGLVTERIGPALSLAVAVPGYLESREVFGPADLSRATLLHCEDRADWRQWLQAAGADRNLAAAGPVFDDEAVLIEAVLAGQGLGLVTWSLVDAEVAAGRLVRAFEQTLPLDYGYYLAYPAGALAQPKVAAFRRFVLGEVRRRPFPGA